MSTKKEELDTREAELQRKEKLLVKFENNVADVVLSRVQTLERDGGITLPKNYSAANSLKSAWLMLQEVKGFNTLTKESIANSLFDMVAQGLNPLKKQCYFVPYGTTLKMSRSYMGSIAVAKRYAQLVHIKAVIIFEDDVFEHSIDLETGFSKVTKYETSFDHKDGAIKGAFCIYKLADGTEDVNTMTMKQIQTSWNQSKTQQAVHKKFPEEMAKRTIYDNTCKLLINTSDDSNLMNDEFNEETHHDTIQQTVDDNLDNAETIDIEDAEVVENVEVSEDEENQKLLDAENAEVIKETEGGKGQVKAKF